MAHEAINSVAFCEIELNTVELPPTVEIRESSIINGVPGKFDGELFTYCKKYESMKCGQRIPGLKTFFKKKAYLVAIFTLKVLPF